MYTAFHLFPFFWRLYETMKLQTGTRGLFFWLFFLPPTSCSDIFYIFDVRLYCKGFLRLIFTLREWRSDQKRCLFYSECHHHLHYHIIQYILNVFCCCLNTKPIGGFFYLMFVHFIFFGIFTSEFNFKFQGINFSLCYQLIYSVAVDGIM